MRILMVALCLAVTVTVAVGQCRKKPVILFWCSTPEKLTNATFITPQVWTPQDEKGAEALKRKPDYEQSAWLKKGITPLRWMGYPHEKREQELVEYWASAANQGYVGIAIDEIGHVSPEVDAKAARALMTLKRFHPNLFVAVWHAGGLTDELLKGYRDGADLILLETYGVPFEMQRYKHWIEERISTVRKAGIIHKTVIALGINDAAPKEEWQKVGQWVNSELALRQLLTFIRQKAPDMPGIAFFAPRASQKMLTIADKLAGEIFGKPAPLHDIIADYNAELRRPDGRVDVDLMVARLKELGVNWGPRDSAAVKWDNENGVYALFYIEPQTYQQSHQDFEQAPTVDEVIGRLKKLADGDQKELATVAATTYRVYPLAHTDEDVLKRIQETAQVVLQSLNHNAFGQPYCSVGRYGWMQKRWGAILSCNLVPALPRGKGWFNIYRVIIPALEGMEKQGARYDGLALDSLGGYGEASRVNYRREHFRYSRFPLSFSAHDHQPVQVAFFTTVEWLQELSRIFHPKGMVFMANCSWGTTPGWLTFAAPYIDIFGAEHPFFADPDFIRAIAYRKPCTDLPYTPRPEWEVAWHLLHGIFPGHGNDLQVLRKYAPLLQQLSEAGWEPITGARVNPPTVRLERFGRGSKIYLTAHNPEEKDVDATIELELETLKLTKFSVSSLLGEKLEHQQGNRLRLSLPAKGTAVLVMQKSK